MWLSQYMYSWHHGRLNTFFLAGHGNAPIWNQFSKVHSSSMITMRLKYDNKKGNAYQIAPHCHFYPLSCQIYLSIEVHVIYLDTLKCISTYLLCCPVNVFHIHKNSNGLCWPLVQHLLHHVFVFWEVLDITCVTLTWVKWLAFVTITPKGITHVEGGTCIL